MKTLNVYMSDDNKTFILCLWLDYYEFDCDIHKIGYYAHNLDEDVIINRLLYSIQKIPIALCLTNILEMIKWCLCVPYMYVYLAFRQAIIIFIYQTNLSKFSSVTLWILNDNKNTVRCIEYIVRVLI